MEKCMEKVKILLNWDLLCLAIVIPGTFYWRSGDCYSGNFDEGHLTGIGCKTHCIDGFIEGSFVKGYVHGFAKKVDCLSNMKVGY